MSELLREEDWDVLLRRIRDGRCTPFLGAGAAYGVLPLGSDIAKTWAQKYNYPMEDVSNLISVAQFLALKFDPMLPKDLIVEMFKNAKSPDFQNALEPHRVLARLPLPVYITTNYDDFLMQALTRRHRDPMRALCQWNKLLKEPTDLTTTPRFTPTVARPLVFHLHGHIPIPESLVLTEDDYIDFMVNISVDPVLIPPQIVKAISGTSLLFIGYSLSDSNFRVLLRSFEREMARGLGHLKVAVMIAPTGTDLTQQNVLEHMTKRYENIGVRVCWATVADFMKELLDRWEASGYET